MPFNFCSDKWMIGGHALQSYPETTGKAYSTFKKAKFECSRYHVDLLIKWMEK